MEKMLILEKALIYALSLIAAIALAMLCESKRNLRLQMRKKRSDVRPSDSLYLVVFIYFFFNFLIILSFPCLRKELFSLCSILDAPVSWLAVVILSLFLSACVLLFFMGFAYLIAGMVVSLRKILHDLNNFHFQKSKLKTPRFDKGLELCAAIVAISMLSFWLIGIFHFSLPLIIVFVSVFIVVLKITVYRHQIINFVRSVYHAGAQQKIIANLKKALAFISDIYDFLHDMRYNDRKIITRLD